MENKSKILLSLSIFTERKNWNLLLNKGVSPFLNKLSANYPLLSYKIEFDYFNRQNIRLSLLIPRLLSNRIEKMADKYFKEFFEKEQDFLIPTANHVSRVFFTYLESTSQNELNEANIILQQSISEAMLEALADEIIDDELIITFGLYMLFGSYKLIPNSSLYFAKKWFSFHTIQTEHIKGIKIDQDLIFAQCEALSSAVEEIYVEAMHITTIERNLSWLDNWEKSIHQILKKTTDEKQAWGILKQINLLINEQLGLNEFSTALLNNLVYVSLLKHSERHDSKIVRERSITMSVFGNFGRLGNQLFQYASLIGIARKHNTNLVLPSWSYAQYFNQEFPTGDCGLGIVVKEFKLSYIDNWGLIDWDQPIDMIGYLQSEKYWQHCKDEVIQALEFKADFKKNIRKKQDFNRPTIAIHIRRGDYVNHPNFAQLPISWFLDALKLFPNWLNSNIMIFSDDIPFCKLYFSHLNNVCFSENNSPIEDLCLMAQCDLFILSNSTFSWWGAYLSGVSGENIIRPDCFYAGQYKADNDDKDFWPESWRIFNH